MLLGVEVTAVVILRNESDAESSYLLKVISLAKNALPAVGGPEHVDCLLGERQLGIYRTLN